MFKLSLKENFKIKIALIKAKKIFQILLKEVKVNILQVNYQILNQLFKNLEKRNIYQVIKDSFAFQKIIIVIILVNMKKKIKNKIQEYLGNFFQFLFKNQLKMINRN